MALSDRGQICDKRQAANIFHFTYRVSLTHRNTPHMLPYTEFGHSRSNVTSVEKLVSRIPSVNHSRSSEPTRIDRLLVSIITMDLSGTVTEINDDFRSKFANFPHPPCI